MGATPEAGVATLRAPSIPRSVPCLRCYGAIRELPLRQPWHHAYGGPAVWLARLFGFLPRDICHWAYEPIQVNLRPRFVVAEIVSTPRSR